MDALVKHCASAILLEEGKIFAEGAPDQVAENYKQLQTTAPRAAT
jgi:ABC-type polysaccharide/polyol phosphate transport system ATPase subunit